MASHLLTLYSYANGTFPKEKATTITLSPSSISATRICGRDLHRNGAKACTATDYLHYDCEVEFVIRSQAGMTDAAGIGYYPLPVPRPLYKEQDIIHTHCTHFGSQIFIIQVANVTY